MLRSIRRNENHRKNAREKKNTFDRLQKTIRRRVVQFIGKKNQFISYFLVNRSTDFPRKFQPKFTFYRNSMMCTCETVRFSRWKNEGGGEYHTTQPYRFYEISSSFFFSCYSSAKLLATKKPNFRRTIPRKKYGNLFRDERKREEKNCSYQKKKH